MNTQFLPSFSEQPPGKAIVDNRIRKAALRLHNNGLDSLTKLPNRSHFLKDLASAIERTRINSFARFGVLFIDFDRFRLINDSFGYTVGDKLLVAMSERLQECVRPGDVVARYGADEFLILLNGSGDSFCTSRAAERVQTRFAEPFFIEGREIFASASIGIVESGGNARSPEDVLRDADSAMYRAKLLGRARFETFDPKIRLRNMNLLQTEADLHRAINRREFEIFYQPIIDLDSLEVLEFEALVRWRHPTQGLILPNNFIPAAEECGLIFQIGSWILEESCRQIAEWQDAYSPSLIINVNISPLQTRDPRFVSSVKDILKRTGLSPVNLRMEITENNMLEETASSRKVLLDLSKAGVRLAVDDFGTGYSSFGYLHRYAFDRIKLDRSFVFKLNKNDKSSEIVRALLSMGEHLKLDVVAEGIQTESQARQLRSFGCRLGQGFLYSKPLDARAAAKLLQQNFEKQ